MSEYWGRKGKLIPRWLMATTASTAQDQARLEDDGTQSGMGVTEFPKHLYPPSQAQTVNLIRAAVINPGATVDLITFQPQFHGILGSNVIFTHYALFNDGLNAANFSFQPLVNGQRVYPYHGSPVDLSGNQSNQFVMAMGMGPDLGDNSLVMGMLALQPVDTLVWRVTNNDVVQVAMGVRHTGYVDQGSRRIERRFGG